jgi:NADH dehydrogenase
MKNTQVCILGGTGFVGHHLATALSAAGYRCRIPTRRPERHRNLLLVPECALHPVDGWSEGELSDAFAGCGTLINLVGILNEMGGRTFEQAHVGLVETALKAAEHNGVRRYLHMSALNANAEKGPSDYLRTKGRGEALAHAAAGRGIAVTSFQPSVIFGHGDSFFNRFAGLLRRLPGPFPLACPNARFAPVFVGDVAQAMVHCLGSPSTAGKAYELCGPRTFTLRELVEYTGAHIGRKVQVIGLSDGISRLQAQVFQHLPGKPFSMDNYLSLRVDSVCTRSGLGELGIRATDIDAVVPGYLK